MTKIPLDKYMGKKKDKFYTISTLVFSNLDAVREQMEEWDAMGKLDYNSKIFEIGKEIKWDNDIRIHDCDEEDCSLW